MYLRREGGRERGREGGREREREGGREGGIFAHSLRLWQKQKQELHVFPEVLKSANFHTINMFFHFQV